MSITPEPLYWDANLFLSYVEGTPGRFETIQAIITAAEFDEVRIYTSTISVAEVAFAGAERTIGVLDPAVAHSIAHLWTDRLLNLVEVSYDIALAARDVVRGSLLHGPRLKPMDAVHLATARHVAVSRMHTFDGQLHKHSERLGFPILAPILNPPRRTP